MTSSVSIRSFSSKFACDLVAYASDHGADRASLLQRLALPPDFMHREDIRVPASRMADVWLAAIQQCQDPMIATHLGQKSFSAQQTTHLIMQSSATVQEACELAVHYSTLIANVMSTSIRDDDHNFYVEFQISPEWQLEHPAVVRDCLQIAMLAAAISIPKLIGSHEPPSVVHFALPAPRFSSELFELFNCPIHFKTIWNAVGFRRELRTAPLASKALGLQAVIRQYADDLRKTFENSRTWADRVRTTVIEQMPRSLTLAEAAKRMNISERSLQRRLNAEGQTYRQIGEEIRLDFVDRYLSQQSRSLEEVAYLSGYHDAPTMIRAYKRRFGKAPRQSR